MMMRQCWDQKGEDAEAEGRRVLGTPCAVQPRWRSTGEAINVCPRGRGSVYFRADSASLETRRPATITNSDCPLWSALPRLLFSEFLDKMMFLPRGRGVFKQTKREAEIKMDIPWKGPLVLETRFEGVGKRRQGKVRDIYELGETLLLVATDRISAFDVVLPDGIPGKGYVLTQLSKFWFDFLGRREEVVSHVISSDVETFPSIFQPFKDLLSGRSMLVHKCDPLPVECIVRGYLSGSAWKEYRESGTVCNQRLPTGLVESEQLREPIFTPSTKATRGHDVNISFDQMTKMVGGPLAEQVRSRSLTVYKCAAAFTEQKGILIADTKFEFGLSPGTDRLVLIDEVLTPDSSRFWPKDGYVPGRAQPSFDKQYVRDSLDDLGWNRQPPAPSLAQEVIRRTSEKYFDALRRIAG